MPNHFIFLIPHTEYAKSVFFTLFRTPLHILSIPNHSFFFIPHTAAHTWYFELTFFEIHIHLCCRHAAQARYSSCRREAQATTRFLPARASGDDAILAGARLRRRRGFCRRVCRCT